MSLPVEDRRVWEQELGLIYLSAIEEQSVDRWPRWFTEAYARVAVAFAAHLIGNAPMFDFDDEGVVAIVREFFRRTDQAIDDHNAWGLLEEAP